MSGSVFLFRLALFQTEIWGNSHLTFRDAQFRLLAYVRNRIHNGELTERGFARLVGVSQPHMHNVLNGVRNISVDLSDSILNIFHISILDLSSPEELEAYLLPRKPPQRVSEAPRDVPFLDVPIGPGIPWPARVDRRRTLPAQLPEITGASSLVMARLARDPNMDTDLAGYDIAILDLSERWRTDPTPEGLYVIERNGEAVLRYLRPGARGYYVVTDRALENPEEWEHLSLSRSELEGFVKARVLWLGNERYLDLPMHQRGRFLYEIISS
jgi:transcriptional regulator with XRE-family HTH domain